MDDGNQTDLRVCRFLSDAYFAEIHAAFIEAYSDYTIAYAPTVEQFRNHIILTGVDLARTAGCFQEGRLIGVTLNGFGEWDGKPTVYDAGTGVVPKHRRQGVSNAMFEMMMPAFKESGIEQCLLEVITTNTPAVKLYEKHGFQPVRELAFLQCDSTLHGKQDLPGDIHIRKVNEPDWNYLTTLWDGKPSWQNSVDAMKRSYNAKHILGAYLGDQCVGYIIYSSHFGRVAQLVVDQNYRNQGIGTALLRGMQADMADGFSMQVINIDKSIHGAMDFFRRHGFREVVSQYEMVKMI